MEKEVKEIILNCLGGLKDVAKKYNSPLKFADEIMFTENVCIRSRKVGNRYKIEKVETAPDSTRKVYSIFDGVSKKLLSEYIKNAKYWEAEEILNNRYKYKHDIDNLRERYYIKLNKEKAKPVYGKVSFEEYENLLDSLKLEAEEKYPYPDLEKIYYVLIGKTLPTGGILYH